MIPVRNKPPHSLLPPDAIALLQKASQTPIPAHDPHARVKAVDKARERIRTMYPNLFTTEEL